MITQQDINKLLEHPDTWQQYLIIGQNVKSKEELINDVVEKLELDYEMCLEFDNQPYFMELLMCNFFGKSFRIVCEPIGETDTPNSYDVWYWDVKEGAELNDLYSQKEEITEEHFRKIIAKFLLTELNKATT